jgi:transposase
MSLPAGDVLRARMILMLADGRSYFEIQERLETTAPTISRWKKRFLTDGVNGLLERPHPGQKPTVITPKLQARVLEATRRKPKDGSTHWSVRKLARELNLSKDTVHRIWRTAGVKPHRLERYMASDDPDFESKAADIIGLYLKPPQHAAVFCVDEKSAIQALDRLDPVLPLSPGRVERHGFEYYGMERCRCTRPWTSNRGKYMGKRRRAIPAKSSSTSWGRSWGYASRSRRFTSSSTICRRIRPTKWPSFWTIIRV